MTDPVPSKEQVESATKCFTQANRCFSDGVCDYRNCEAGRTLIEEIERLRTALRGVQSCSTCEACRGAATLALGGAKAKPAHERESPHCSTCACGLAPEPPADAKDAARYRWLRADNAYAPEENMVMGGEELDHLCDDGISSSQPPGDGQ